MATSFSPREDVVAQHAGEAERRAPVRLGAGLIQRDAEVREAPAKAPATTS